MAALEGPPWWPRNTQAISEAIAGDARSHEEYVRRMTDWHTRTTRLYSDNDTIIQIKEQPRMHSNVTITQTHNSPRSMLAQDIPRGTYFTGAIGVHEDTVFLRIADRIIDLSDGDWWDDLNTRSSLKVRDYQVVDIAITTSLR